MKIALYFGSFNPIHLGHMIIANHIAEFIDYINYVWFIVSPQNPLKMKKNLLDYETRIKMVKIAINDFKKMSIIDIESGYYPSYTIHTLNRIEKKFPKIKFYILLGEDCYSSLRRWNSYKTILNKYNIIVYPRLGIHVVNPVFNSKKKVIFINAPIIEISSSFIRNSIRSKKDVRLLLPYKIWNYIKKHNIF